MWVNNIQKHAKIPCHALNLKINHLSLNASLKQLIKIKRKETKYHWIARLFMLSTCTEIPDPPGC